MNGKKIQKSRRSNPESGIPFSFWTSGKKSMDPTFVMLIIVALAFGLIMILSASAPTARAKVGQSYHFFIRQLAFAVVGFVMMLVVSRVDYHIYKRFIGVVLIICEIFLLAVLSDKIGIEKNGARRWIKTGFEWQPSELIKPSIAIFFAMLIEKRKTNFAKIFPIKNYIKEVWIYLAWLGITGFLLMKEPHLSGTIVVFGIAGIMIIVAGLPMWLVISGGTVGGYIGYLLIQRDPVRWARMVNFKNPFEDVQDVGYQVVQSLYAIGTGGLFGRGLGQSVQKYSYLPEPHNDFIFSVICEELGLIGGALVIFLIAGIVIRGIKIASEAPDTFGTLMVVGIMAQVGIQSFLNIAVTTSTVPNTGVSLPFFSYGGTALVVLLCEMGIVLNVSRQSQKMKG